MYDLSAYMESYTQQIEIRQQTQEQKNGKETCRVTLESIRNSDLSAYMESYRQQIEIKQETQEHDK